MDPERTLRNVERWERLVRALTWRHFPASWETLGKIMDAELDDEIRLDGFYEPSALVKAQMRQQFLDDFKQLIVVKSFRKHRPRGSVGLALLRHFFPKRQSFDYPGDWMDDLPSRELTGDPRALLSEQEGAHGLHAPIETENAELARGAAVAAPALMSKAVRGAAEWEGEAGIRRVFYSLQDNLGGLSASTPRRMPEGAPPLLSQAKMPAAPESAAEAPAEEIMLAEELAEVPAIAAVPREEADAFIDSILPAEVLEDPADPRALQSLEQTKTELREALANGSPRPLYDSDDGSGGDGEAMAASAVEAEADGKSGDDRAHPGLMRELEGCLGKLTRIVREMADTEAQYYQQLSTIHRFFDAMSYDPSSAAGQVLSDPAVLALMTATRGLRLPTSLLCDCLEGLAEQLARVVAAYLSPDSPSAEHGRTPESVADATAAAASVCEGVGCAFRQLLPALPLYGSYITYYGQVNRILHIKHDKMEALVRTYEGRVCGGRTFQSILITPVQRGPRYVLLLKTLRKEADKCFILADRAHEEGAENIVQESWVALAKTLAQAVGRLDVSISGVQGSVFAANEKVRRRQHRLALHKLFRKIRDGDSDPNVIPENFVRPNRQILLAGALRKFNRRGGQSVYYCHLLNDLFLYSEPAKNDGLKLHCAVHLAYEGCSVHRLPPTERIPSGFIVVGRRRTLVFSAKSNQECLMWHQGMATTIAELAQPRPADNPLVIGRLRDKAGASTDALRGDAHAIVDDALEAVTMRVGEKFSPQPVEDKEVYRAGQNMVAVDDGRLRRQRLMARRPSGYCAQESLMEGDGSSEGESSDEENELVPPPPPSLTGIDDESSVVSTAASDADLLETPQRSRLGSIEGSQPIWQLLRERVPHDAAGAVAENIAHFHRIQSLFTPPATGKVPDAIASLTASSASSSVGSGAAEVSGHKFRYVSEDHFFDMQSGRPRLVRLILLSHAVIIGEVLSAQNAELIGFAELNRLRVTDLDTKENRRHAIELSCSGRRSPRSFPMAGGAAGAAAEVPAKRFKCCVSAGTNALKYKWLDLLAQAKREYVRSLA